MFSAARGDLPLKVRLKDILKADDPDGIIRELGIEEARLADPAIALHELALRYVEEAEDIEDDDEADAKLIQAKMLTEQGVSIIRQRMQPQQTPMPVEAKVPEKEGAGVDSLVPLLGGGTPGARGPAPAEEE